MRAPSSTSLLAQREQLVRAAADVLRRHGLDACTTWAATANEALGGGAPAEHFGGAHTLVEIALHRLTEWFLDAVHDAAAAASDPLGALWDATTVYLADGTWSLEGGRAVVAELTTRTERCFTNLVAATGVPDAAAVGSAWAAALTGYQLRQRLTPRPVEGVLDELSRSFALPRPAPTR